MGSIQGLSRYLWIVGMVSILGVAVSVPACTQEAIPTFPDTQDDQDDDDDDSQDDDA